MNRLRSGLSLLYYLSYKLDYGVNHFIAHNNMVYWIYLNIFRVDKSRVDKYRKTFLEFAGNQDFGLSSLFAFGVVFSFGFLFFCAVILSLSVLISVDIGVLSLILVSSIGWFVVSHLLLFRKDYHLDRFNFYAKKNKSYAAYYLLYFVLFLTLVAFFFYSLDCYAKTFGGPS